MADVMIDAPRCPVLRAGRDRARRKGLAHETVVIDLDDRPGWLYEKNPAGGCRCSRSNGWALPESVVINEFLEERYPGPCAASRRSRRAGRRPALDLP